MTTTRRRNRKTAADRKEEGVGCEVKKEKKTEVEEKNGEKLRLPCPPSVGCRVDGCVEDLWASGDYHRKLRVCRVHATAEKVLLNQQEQRFCQQCSRFHTLGEFDKGKKSCRKRLAYHNARRRRHQLDSQVKSNGDATQSKGVGKQHEDSFRPDQVLSLEPVALPKSLKLKAGSNGDGKSIQKKSKRLKKNDKQTNTLKNLDQNSIKCDMQERMPNVSTFCPQATFNLGAHDTVAFYPHYRSSLRDGIQLGDGIVLPPLAVRREGRIVLLQEWPRGMEGAGNVDAEDVEDKRRVRKSLCKKDWQKGDWETLFHCLWDCPKVQPVWRWAARALSKIRGRKVSLEWKQAVLGEKLGAWALPEINCLWKLLRGIILGQVWHARKGKVYSGKQWTPGQIIRSTWADLMMYAMHEWLEVLKAKESSTQDEAQFLCTQFDNKWLVNGFVGRRTEWSMSWKNSYEVLLD